MTARAFANVDGLSLLSATIHVPNVGPWWADVVFEGAPEAAGAVVLNVGTVAMSGTIDPARNGTFGLQRRARIIGGGGGWGSPVASQHYHNDAGVRAATVADDAARLASESMGDFAIELTFVGVDYVRQSGPASRVLEDVIGSATWWVGFDGLTQVGQRTESTPSVDAYQVLEHDPSSRVATVAVTEVDGVTIGAVLTEGLDAPLTVRELRIEVSPESLRVKAWGGGSVAGRGRLAGLLRGIARRSSDDRLHGKWKYRVVRMSGERVELQVVSTRTGLPDAIPLSMRPGVAGAHASLAGGAIVLVEFVEGDRTQPIITAFSGRDAGSASDPSTLDFSVTTTLRLGGPTASDAVALAPGIDTQLDDINQALDAFAVAIPVPNDGGALVHSAFTAVWGAGLPPKAPSSVGATKVVAE